ncbi:hypothetical protein QOZ80_5AG0402990 [Eleusine coracana subsp. coracana]|nr:hypothetical protein QOZ80_5AG0402990 [Eleusine coracana subsp. coracana]
MAFNSSSSGYCTGILQSFVSNLTFSYADQRNEASMVATSVIMFALATLFFNLNIFSGLSDMSAILNPSVRFFLSTSLSLFLPVMSYLFSEAKNDESTNTGWTMTELSFRARTILLWMLLVELLRKKVEAILVSAGGVPGYSGTIERAARIAWLGYLVFHNIRSAGKRALYGALWVLAAAKLVQRRPGEEGQYRLIEPRGQIDSTAVTIGKIWNTEKMTLFQKQDPPGLKRLRLSLALCKLLRRMLEGFPITPLEAQHCHRVIFDGLCQDDDDDDAAVALFQVLNDEVQFLSEYYHSVHPVVLSSPFFFLANYILFPVVVSALCVLTAILSGYGDVLYAVHSFNKDNYIVANSVLKMTGCLLSRIAASPVNLFSAIDVFITMLLFLAFVYERRSGSSSSSCSPTGSWSRCSAATSPPAGGRILVDWAVRAILRVRSTLMSRPSVSFKHLSVLCLHTPSSPGRCESDSIADVILTWHIATVVLEAKQQQQQNTEVPLPGGASSAGDRKVATVLSGYCAYLVAFQPELLPDDKDGTERVYKDTMAEMKKKMGCWAFYCFTQEARVGKLIMEIAEAHDDDDDDGASQGSKAGKGPGGERPSARVEASGRALDRGPGVRVAGGRRAARQGPQGSAGARRRVHHPAMGARDAHRHYPPGGDGWMCCVR